MYLDYNYVNVLNRYLCISHIRYYIYVRKEVSRILSKYLPKHIIRFSILGYVCPHINELIGVSSFPLTLSNRMSLLQGYNLRVVTESDGKLLCVRHQNKILCKIKCVPGNQKQVCSLILKHCLVSRLTNEEIDFVVRSIKTNQSNAYES